jgi:hypothetical protein
MGVWLLLKAALSLSQSTSKDNSADVIPVAALNFICEENRDGDLGI